ncbi:MAG: Lysine--tRNA ligase [Chlamydiae bacterium]|nr:Lysine--tRNA ligase [Chlamydiota bacterium]
MEHTQSDIEKPEYHSHEEFQNRSRKLSEIRDLGIDPYPHKFPRTDPIRDLVKEYEDKEVGHSDDASAGKTPHVSAAGRLVLFRSMGKNAFGQIQGQTGRIQVMFNRDLTEIEGYQPDPSANSDGPTPWKLLEKKLDLGDILGVEGHLFHTNKGELTIFVKKLTLLCKTLLPLADKHCGLHDKETRYRKRWLDLISNEETHRIFEMRSRIFYLIRQFMMKEQFMEVETPVLQSVYGGADAQPFETHLNALSQDMFMRISLEIPLKKLIVGGMHRIFEIGRVFRNEGIDRNHNPEFTMLEAYASYWDYFDLMSLVENLFEHIALDLYGSTKVPAKDPKSGLDIELDMKSPWPRLTLKEAIKKFGHLDVDQLSDEEMSNMLLQSEHCAPEKLKTMNRGLFIAALFEVFAEPYLIQPHHIIDHPIETTPLCKPHRNETDRLDGIVERFESFILGNEICNAYSELNDPELQRSLLEQQALRREGGDPEACPLDEEFIESVCQGMPPTAGVGIGLDRMVMILANCHSIRDVLLFPWMKPQTEIEFHDN